ncbi:hypothetical protein ACHAWF_005915 [Thalassiosira exigua]
MIAAWKREDPPPMRVKPVPIQVLRRLAYIAQHSHPTNHLIRATVDMIIIAFFFSYGWANIQTRPPILLHLPWMMFNSLLGQRD